MQTITVCRCKQTTSQSFQVVFYSDCMIYQLFGCWQITYLHYYQKNSHWFKVELITQSWFLYNGQFKINWHLYKFNRICNCWCDINDFILNAIISIRNNKKRPDSNSIFDYINRELINSDITHTLVETRLSLLTVVGKLEIRGYLHHKSIFCHKVAFDV